MSTVKTDVITAVSTNGDLSLDGLGSGGVSIASTLKMTKGGDIASASPLVIDTDGNYFDVTGTTNFAAMTVEAGNFFMLQFDGALTITHGSGIELPGAANLTTAAGDRLICYATAADTVEVMNVATEAAAGGGAWAILSSGVVTDAYTSVIATNITTKDIRITLSNIEGQSDDSFAWDFEGNFSTDNGSTYETGANYNTHAMRVIDNATGVNEDETANQTKFILPANNALFIDNYDANHRLCITINGSTVSEVGVIQWEFVGGGNDTGGYIHRLDGVGVWKLSTVFDAFKLSPQKPTSFRYVVEEFN